MPYAVTYPSHPLRHGFSPLPPAPLREFAVGAYAEYVKRGVLPFVPGKLRRVGASRAA